MVGSRWDTGRIEAFSDGVFAFAITLLVLDIAVPESGLDHLWHSLAHQWPSYLGYVTSFLTVGGIWMLHHGMFRRMQYANHRMMTVNLVLLMAVAFLPFPTRLVAEAIRNSSAERSAVILHGAWLLVISLILSALWASVASDGSLLNPGVSEKEINAIARVTSPSLGFYIGVIALAFVAPKVAAFGYLVIAIVAVVRAPGLSGPAPTTVEPP